MLTCSTCKEEKDKNLFHKNTTVKRGYLHSCKTCTNAYQRELAKQVKEKISSEELKLKRRKKQLKYCYGISLEQYQKKLEEQSYSCEICGVHEKDTSKETLFIDHNHNCGSVRGLLCQHCNSVLGYAKDSVLILANCIKYLEKYK